MIHAIDFDILRQELSSVIVEGDEERYQFTLPDKKKSILLPNAPLSATLRPCWSEYAAGAGISGRVPFGNLSHEAHTERLAKDR